MLWMSLCGHKSVGIDVLRVYLESKSASLPVNDNNFRQNIIKDIIENIKEDAIREQSFTKDDSDEKEYESLILD